MPAAKFDLPRLLPAPAASPLAPPVPRFYRCPLPPAPAGERSPFTTARACDALSGDDSTLSKNSRYCSSIASVKASGYGPDASLQYRLTSADTPATAPGSYQRHQADWWASANQSTHGVYYPEHPPPADGLATCLLRECARSSPAAASSTPAAISLISVLHCCQSVCK